MTANPSRPPLPGGPYLVVGLARSGLAAAEMLSEHGEVIGVDSGKPETVPAGVEAHLGADGVGLLDRVQTVVKSPGVPREAPVIAAALDRGIDVVGELELAWRLLPNRFIAVTGTNGKTTTVGLLERVYADAERAAEVAGNVGRPLSSLVGETDPGSTVIVEVSSFQLEDSTAFAPEVALLLNLEEDHLDRHGSFDAYREAKLLVFARQGPDATAVAPLGTDLPGEAERVTFGTGDADLALRDGRLEWRGEPVIGAEELGLRGAHNVENSMGAAAAALADGVDPETVARALAGFKGVPHRLEEVAERGGVLYVNDSKATNVASAVRGIQAFEPGRVHVILGGSLKGGGFTGLREAASRCRALYLIGEAQEHLAADLEGSAPITRSGTLEAAVETAREAAQPGDVVLLSPACASYDQFRDYEERGGRFRALARGE